MKMKIWQYIWSHYWGKKEKLPSCPPSYYYLHRKKRGLRWSKQKADVNFCVQYFQYLMLQERCYKKPRRGRKKPSKALVVQSLSFVQLFATPRTAALQASLSFTVSWSLLKLMSIELVMLSNLLTILSSVTPFSSCRQSFPASESFPVSRLFASGGWSIGALGLWNSPPTPKAWNSGGLWTSTSCHQQ